MKHREQTSSVLKRTGCLACVLLVLSLPILAYRLIFKRSPVPQPVQAAGSPPASAPVGADLSFVGRYVSDLGRTSFELRADEKRFSFYTPIQQRLLLQTEISPYEIVAAEDGGLMIEISGEDKQAGGSPVASFKITRQEGGAFRLMRLQPVGGDLGVFHKKP